MNEYTSYNLTNPDNYVGGPPFEIYKQLRHNAPIYKHVDEITGETYWAITKHEHISYISKNPKEFSSHEKACFYPTPEEDERLVQLQTQMINMDPPQHLKFRRVVREAFTPKMVNSYEARFREIAKGLVDKVLPKGKCEFVSEIACELPLIAICELMGVPLEDRGQFFEWTNTMLGADDPDLTTSQDDSNNAMIGLFQYGMKLAEMHRENPKNNIVGVLLDGVVEGEQLNEMEFCNFFLLLMVAGNETTRTVTSHAMRLLIQHPEQYRRLQEEPSLVSSAIEEFLRYNTAVMHFARTATKDVTLDGQLIKKGERVVMFYSSANRDEDVFSEPDKFDVTRPCREDVEHLHRSFGFGEHFCLGTHLARLELRVVFDEIVKRIDNPQFDGDIQWLRSHFINGIKEMPIRFQPKPVEA